MYSCAPRVRRRPSGRAAAIVFVVCLVAAASPQTAATQGSGEMVGSVRLVLPSGWQRVQRGERLLLVPPRTSSDVAMLSVEPGVDARESLAAWFDRAWGTLVRGYRGVEVAGPPQGGAAAAGHTWRWQIGSMQDGSGGHLYVFLMAARDGARVQPLVFLSRDYATFDRHQTEVGMLLQTGLRFLPAAERPPPAVERLVTASEVLASAAAPPRTTAPPSSSTRTQPATPARSGAAFPTPRGRVWGRAGGSPFGAPITGALDGIWEGLSRGLSAAPTGGTQLGVSRRQITFYPDGRVHSRVPEGGLEGFDRDASERAAPSLWGRYQQVSPGRWSIRWNEASRPVEVRREGDGLRVDGEVVFPVATLEGMRLDGTYRLRSAGADVPFSLTLRADGRFRDDELIGALAYENIAMPVPRTIAGGAGVYRIRRNTLELAYDDGRHVFVAIHASPEAARATPVSAISISGWPLERVR